MSKGIRKQQRHVRRGAAFARDHIGRHRNIFSGKGIWIDSQGREQLVS